MAMTPWYVLRVMTQQELFIEKRVRDLGFNAASPWYEGQKYVRGNRRQWRRPLYVGYVFVELPDHAAGWQMIRAELNSTDRRTVFRLLGGTEPAELRQSDAEYLRSIADGNFRFEDAAPTLVVGDSVIVPDGYLEGQTSTIVKIRGGNRAKLKVTGEKNDIYLEMPLANLKKA